MFLYSNIIYSCYYAELDALGDDMLMDDDTSYLDSATIPDPPNTVPQTTRGQTNVSTMSYVEVCIMSVIFPVV